MDKPKADLPQDFYIKPLPGFVICKSLEEKQEGGISIPDTMSNKDSGGLVVAVGDSYELIEGNTTQVIKPGVKVGDRIIFGNYGAQKYLDFKTGKWLFILKFHPDPRFSEILAIIT